MNNTNQNDSRRKSERPARSMVLRICPQDQTWTLKRLLTLESSPVNYNNSSQKCPLSANIPDFIGPIVTAEMVNPKDITNSLPHGILLFTKNCHDPYMS